jgi:hypothetical protein
MDGVVAERARRQRSNTDRETFARAAKGLVRAGPMAAGALLVAFTQRTPHHKLSVRSGQDGPATFAIPAVHMVPAPPGSKADWERYWASLTFEIGA